jgi:4-hydroxythreonine-4-phosphate dehydrogenase
MKPIIAVSMGDYNGIGPEVTLKAFANTNLQDSIPVWVGSEKVFRYYLNRLDLSLPFKTIQVVESLQPGQIYLFDPFDDSGISLNPGKLSKKAGTAAMKAVEAGARFCIDGKSHALVTAPISKEAISKAGYTVPGHTEFLAGITSTQNVVMMLVSRSLRVALSTIHIPLKEVAESINEKLMVEQLKIIHQSLQKEFGITSPNIAVLGLNPHAGDGGVIGDEEIRIIRPAIQKVKEAGLSADGPFPADGFFGSHLHEGYDVTFALYHDQGLIPFKTLSFGEGVNFTAGLPFLRTSPDHGTAFAIAGKNKADEQSFMEAYQLAVTMAGNRLT